MNADYEQPIVVTKEGIHNAQLYFDWEQNTVGFGQCSLSMDIDGNITADTECMSKEWLRRALHVLVDTLVDNATIE